jgi:hypothetical protein
MAKTEFSNTCVPATGGTSYLPKSLLNEPDDVIVPEELNSPLRTVINLYRKTVGVGAGVSGLTRTAWAQNTVILCLHFLFEYERVV